MYCDVKSVVVVVSVETVDVQLKVDVSVLEVAVLLVLVELEDTAVVEDEVELEVIAEELDVVEVLICSLEELEELEVLVEIGVLVVREDVVDVNGFEVEDVEETGLELVDVVVVLDFVPEPATRMYAPPATAMITTRMTTATTAPIPVFCECKPNGLGWSVFKRGGGEFTFSSSKKNENYHKMVWRQNA